MALPERLQELEAQFQQAAEEFKQASADFSEQLRETQEQFPPLSEEQEEELQEHYRSGRAGAELRELQTMVDRGDVTWDQIKQGEEHPELTEKYYRSMGEANTYFQAAAEGRDIEEFLPEENHAEEDGPDDQGNSQRGWLI